jgi:hypothetical protein
MLVTADFAIVRRDRPPFRGRVSLASEVGHSVGGRGLGITRVRRLAAPSVWTVPHAVSASRATLAGRRGAIRCAAP